MAARLQAGVLEPKYLRCEAHACTPTASATAQRAREFCAWGEGSDVTEGQQLTLVKPGNIKSILLMDICLTRG